MSREELMEIVNQQTMKIASLESQMATVMNDMLQLKQHMVAAREERKPTKYHLEYGYLRGGNLGAHHGRVRDLLSKGWSLLGSPSYHDGEVVQALVQY